MIIECCLGSSCHVKNGPQILNLLKKTIAEKNLEDTIELAGCMCLGHCAEPGANIRINGKVITGITDENFNDFWTKNIEALF
ncbi:MAG TPA: (2Fe-2S) ferredoxin domain-containing protein [Treponemataceae bacterium]|nr:(2Fe-2S) ferredoxin domain-containing protein [Treponemataceae bacterium]